MRKTTITYDMVDYKDPNEIEIGDYLVLRNNLLFYVDDIELEFANKKVAALYDDDYDGEVLPEHNKYFFFNDRTLAQKTPIGFELSEGNMVEANYEKTLTVLKPEYIKFHTDEN